MRQNNGVDCGLFAIAFLTSYCLRQELAFELKYDLSKMREHLLACYENYEMTEFPLTDKFLNPEQPQTK